MIDAAFTIRIADAQDAKDALGIEHQIDLAITPDPGLAMGWIDLRKDPWEVVLYGGLAPAFASFCLWHELGHARQVERDYGGDVVGFLSDYAAYARGPWGEYDDDPDVQSRRFNLAPWEAEAHLTAWEHRMRVLTGPGIDELIDPDTARDTAQYFANVCVTVDEITEAALDWRHI